MGSLSPSEMKTSAQRKSLYIQVNCSVPSAARAGRQSGSVMRQYCVHTLAPSTIAASRISWGRVRMKLARTKTQNPIWKPTWTEMTDQYESNIVIESDIQYGNGMRLNRTYSGVTITCWGSRFPA